MESKGNKEIPSLERGAEVIRKYAATLPDKPGVYRMLSHDGTALYVGKAKSLKKRVVTYSHVKKLPVRLQRMVAETHDMMFVHTHTESEALLLESNLIKKLKPRYNILMRDDKSFPYIFLSGDHDFPLLTKHRGSRKRKGDYYGPFASVGAVNHTINILQRAFMLRNCSDSDFATRKRPCLQYHIKRCTAPCVGYVDRKEYNEQVKAARDFLSGKSREVQGRFARAMQEASDRQDYEEAARYRDRIKALSAVQAKQDINFGTIGDADVVALYMDGGKSCIQVFFFRGGQNFGNRAYFPAHDAEDTPEDILGAFLAQFYENKPVPPEIIISHKIKEQDLLERALTERNEELSRQIKITVPERGVRRDVLSFVLNNARDALAQEKLKLAGEKKMLQGVADLFGMDKLPERIEVYDNSHISGTNMVGAMIVAGSEGLRKNAYRKFNIRTAEASDDYGMMREVMDRRFKKAAPDEEGWPDLLLVDGGKGQLSTVLKVLDEYGVTDSVTVVGIAKGPDRDAGREKFFMRGRDMFQLPVNDPVLHYLQRLRDEAHRFAIGAHRTRRKQDISKSPLDGIPGIGAKRKKALLHRFGSAQDVAAAGVKDLQKAEGISKDLAQVIYDYFH